MTRWIISGRQRVAHAYLGIYGSSTAIVLTARCEAWRDFDDKSARGKPRCKRCLLALRRERGT